MIHGEWTRHILESKERMHIYVEQLIQASNTVDFMVSKKRDKKAAKIFFRKALKAEYNQSPRVITTDRYSATEMAILEERYYGDISYRTEHRMCKYLNNIVEQDHRFIKKKIKPMLGFRTLESTEKTVAGIEIMHMIKKGQVKGISCVKSEVQFISEIKN